MKRPVDVPSWGVWLISFVLIAHGYADIIRPADARIADLAKRASEKAAYRAVPMDAVDRFNQVKNDLTMLAALRDKRSDAATVMTAIDRLARVRGVTVTAVAPRSTGGAAGYTIDVSGNYPALVRFVYDLSSASFLTRTDGVKITAGNHDAAAAMDVATIDLTTEVQP
jgi:hypothetical protein